MIALQITEIKDFMNKLLRDGIFDHFLVQEACIYTGYAWTLDGAVRSGYLSVEEIEEQGLTGLSFMPFGAVRTQCFDLVKGKRTPSQFRFVFLLSPENLARTLEQAECGLTPNDVSGMFLNFKYQNASLTLTTGVSYRTFTMDKTLDREWDSLVQKFLRQHQISYVEL